MRLSKAIIPIFVAFSLFFTTASAQFLIKSIIIGASDITQTSPTSMTISGTTVNFTAPTPVKIEFWEGGAIGYNTHSFGQPFTVQPGSPFSHTLSGLVPNSSYSFQIVDVADTTLTYTSVLNFVTQANSVGVDTSVPITACSSGSDGYCLLAPIGGVERISDTQLQDYFGMIYKIVIGLTGVLAVIMIFFGGVQYMTSDALLNKSEGKEKIKNAVLGLIIALGSFAILNTVNPQLLNFRFGINKVEIAYEAPLNPVFTSGGGAVGVSNISTNLTTYDAMLLNAATTNGIECTLIKAFMMTESGGNPTAQSPVGAKGLLQLMPATAQGLGVNPNDLFDPAVSINAGAKLLKQLSTTACNGGPMNSVCNVTNYDFVIAAYNAGPGANRKAKSCENTTLWQCVVNPGYAETRNYVPKVKANYNTLKANNWGC